MTQVIVYENLKGASNWCDNLSSGPQQRQVDSTGILALHINTTVWWCPFGRALSAAVRHQVLVVVWVLTLRFKLSTPTTPLAFDKWILMAATTMPKKIHMKKTARSLLIWTRRRPMRMVWPLWTLSKTWSTAKPSTTPV
jgi:hypothetical protein